MDKPYVASKNASSFITTNDKTQIFYKDWRNPNGSVVLFSHDWPLNSDNWENQMFFMANQGYRCIAHDKRGHGRSSQTWSGNDNLNEVIEQLHPKNIMLLGHSTGGGEVIRYCARYGTRRVSKVALVGAVTPVLVQKDTNPNRIPLSIFDDFRAATRTNRAEFFLKIPSGPFFGFNRPQTNASQGLIQSWYQQGMICGFKNAYDCIAAFSETDFTEDMKGLEIPCLLIHGEDDQIVPLKDSADTGVALLKNATLKVYPGGSHALPNMNIEQVNQDLLKFAK